MKLEVATDNLGNYLFSRAYFDGLVMTFVNCIVLANLTSAPREPVIIIVLPMTDDLRPIQASSSSRIYSVFNADDVYTINFDSKLFPMIRGVASLNALR